MHCLIKAMEVDLSDVTSRRHVHGFMLPDCNLFCLIWDWRCSH